MAETFIGEAWRILMGAQKRSHWRWALNEGGRFRKADEDVCSGPEGPMTAVMTTRDTSHVLQGIWHRAR